MKEEQIKQVADIFARMSFMLETAVKLYQTGDYPDMAEIAMINAKNDALKLIDSLNLIINHE